MNVWNATSLDDDTVIVLRVVNPLKGRRGLQLESRVQFVEIIKCKSQKKLIARPF
jgi:hypothetical protein